MTKLIPIGGGKFKLDTKKGNYIYENFSLKVYFQFGNDEPVELEGHEIPKAVKKEIFKLVPDSIREDLEDMGW